MTRIFLLFLVLGATMLHSASGQDSSRIELNLKVTSGQPLVGATYLASNRVHLRGLFTFYGALNDPSESVAILDFSMLVNRELERGLAVYVGPNLRLVGVLSGRTGGAAVGFLGGTKVFVHERLALFGEAGLSVSINSPQMFGLFSSGIGLSLRLGG